MRNYLCHKKSKFEGKIGTYIVAAGIGFLIFLIIYGWTPLNVQNDAWIMAGYDEVDIKQHYAGWLAFRNSRWTFPLGMAENMAVGTGTIISFTDSIPWVAIFFKLFRNALPETFQYFGLYTVLCYILQAIAAFKILYGRTKNMFYSYIGIILFCFAPILMERAFRHTALGSQWLILFSIYLYLEHCRKAEGKTYIWYLLLEVLAIGIHPYFLPMVASFSLLCVVEDFRYGNWKTSFIFGGQLVLTYLTGCLLGVLGQGISSSRKGFGYYSMNLNAFYNPTSCGGYNWSSILKIHEQILGNYDGFNYLGFGILLSLFLLLALMLVTNRYGRVLGCLKRNWPVCILIIFLTLFAVSNVITYNGRELFTIPLPQWILKLCGIFRASSRLFYPVYYLLYVFLLFQWWDLTAKYKKSHIYIMVLLCICVQIFDLQYTIAQKHRHMRENAEYVSILDETVLREEIRTCDALFLEKDVDVYKQRNLCIWALKNNLKTYFSVANSGDYSKSQEMALETLQKQKDMGRIGGVIIATTMQETANQYLTIFDDGKCYFYDEVYLIYKK